MPHCYPRCDIHLERMGTRKVTTWINAVCPKTSAVMKPPELQINLQLDQWQRSIFTLDPSQTYHEKVIGSSMYPTQLSVHFSEGPRDFIVKACLKPMDESKYCFMDQSIPKHDVWSNACREANSGMPEILVYALLSFVFLLIAMASTVIIYRFWSIYKSRRAPPEIVSHSDTTHLTSPPRPFHAQLTVVMEEEEEKCSPSTPVKEFWRSTSPTPTSTPRATISMHNTSPIISSLQPKMQTPKPSNV